MEQECQQAESMKENLFNGSVEQPPSVTPAVNG